MIEFLVAFVVILAVAVVMLMIAVHRIDNDLQKIREATVMLLGLKLEEIREEKELTELLTRGENNDGEKETERNGGHSSL